MTEDIKNLTPFTDMGDCPTEQNVSTEMMIIGVGVFYSLSTDFHVLQVWVLQ